MKKIGLIILLLLVTTPMRAQSTPREVTDMAGRAVTLPAEINRIGTVGAVGVLNTFVETMGQGAKIYNQMPGNFKSSGHWTMQYEFAPQLARGPLFEGFNRELLLENIIMADLDVCFTMTRETAEILTKNNVPCIYLEWKHPEDVKQAVKLMGKVLNAPETAERYIAYFDEKIAWAAKLTACIDESAKPIVLYGNPIQFSQPHVIAEWWIVAAGGVSATTQANSGTVSYNMEDLLRWNPDVMILMDCNVAADLRQNKLYQDLKAVQNEAFHFMPTVGHSWGNRTPEQPLTVLWTMHKLYPEIMTYDMLYQEIKEFYAAFFKYEMSEAQVAKIIND